MSHSVHPMTSETVHFCSHLLVVKIHSITEMSGWYHPSTLIALRLCSGNAYIPVDQGTSITKLTGSKIHQAKGQIIVSKIAMSCHQPGGPS